MVGEGDTTADALRGSPGSESAAEPGPGRRPGPARRKSAEVRREELVAVATQRFALEGYKAASTDAIARDAGISQPYLFRLFRTKRDLFLACHQRVHEAILAAFEAAAEGLPRERRMQSMGQAYIGFLADRSQLLFQMQSYAACADPAIQAQVRQRYGELVGAVARLTDAPAHEVWGFFAHGMLLNVVASLDLASIADGDPWAAAWARPEALIEPEA